LRCRPELAPYPVQQNLAHAIWQSITAGSLNGEQSIQDLAQQVGVSARQLQRLMQAHFGVSPIELVQTTRLLFAKKLLQETNLPMPEVAYSAGFGSVRRFNALFISRYGLSPSAIRRHEAAHANPNEITLRLAYRAPFAWDAMLDYLARRIIRGVEAVDTDKKQRYYARSVILDHGATRLEGWYKVTHVPQEQQVHVEIASQLTRILMPLMARIRQQFDLDANPLIIAAHLRSDAVLDALIQKTPGLRVPGSFDHFELAMRAVLGQQVSVAAASTLAERLVQRFGTRIKTPFAHVTHHFPEAVEFQRLPVEEVMQLGLPKARAMTLLALARLAAEGGFDLELGANLEETIARLKQVPGIGDWTAHYIALRALRFPDAFPAKDLGLQKALAKELKKEKKISEAQLLDRAKHWSPWRAYAALLLWQS
jgi:AraC family transcriptional regulator of adaptative response / DNA-3-methyladenine glycosylase II